MNFFQELAKLLPEAPTFIEIWLGTTRKFAGHPERKHRIAEIVRPHVEVSGQDLQYLQNVLETQHLPRMVTLPKTKLANLGLVQTTSKSQQVGVMSAQLRDPSWPSGLSKRRNA